MSALATMTDATASAALLARCVDCHAPLEGRSACSTCGRAYPEDDGILAAIGPLSGTNRIAAAFYDGPAWPRFRPWEQLFLWFQKGPRAARMQILRHLPAIETARVLEVGIGDGENLPLLPRSWTVYGMDIARNRLKACRQRFPGMSGRLVWAEGEVLPFPDQTFDVVYTIGGFNYFRDHTAALREMRRVARAEAPVIAADEIPTLFEFSLGHMLGLQELDHWALRAMGLDAEFVTMVLSHRVDVLGIAKAELPGHRHFPIWNRLGYCLVDPDPRRLESRSPALGDPFHVGQ